MTVKKGKPAKNNTFEICERRTRYNFVCKGEKV
jgi:hypothetical protein